MDPKERKFKILNAIIKEYISSAEPIGSRTLQKRHDLGVSSATIRNEMADLEEMGYLVQPHTSAGRIPSQKAYRLYVDQFMNVFSLDDLIEEEVRGVYQRYLGELNEAIEQTAQILTKLTNYTSMVVTPRIDALLLKDIKLVGIDNDRIMLIIVTKEGLIKNTEIRLKCEYTLNELETVNNALIYIVRDSTLENISDKLSGALEGLSANENRILSEIIPPLKELINRSKATQVYSKGVSQIFNFPEFNSVERAKGFVEALHDKKVIENVLSNDTGEDINIKIGNENEIELFNDCSIITANYKLNGKPIGTIGLIGPTRMNYDYAVSALDFLSGELTRHITKVYKE